MLTCCFAELHLIYLHRSVTKSICRQTLSTERDIHVRLLS